MFKDCRVWKFNNIDKLVDNAIKDFLLFEKERLKVTQSRELLILQFVKMISLLKLSCAREFIKVDITKC